jgi:hypothetical protein
VKCDTIKLSTEGSLRSLKMNLLVLVVQLIVLSEDIDSGMTSARSNNADKLANLDDSIRRQMMQLHSELTQNVHKDRMRRYVKPSSEDFFEHNIFLRSRL